MVVFSSNLETKGGSKDVKFSPQEIAYKERMEKRISDGGRGPLFKAYHVVAFIFMAVFFAMYPPSLAAVFVSWWWADAYSAVLHWVLDHEWTTRVPFLSPVAIGFQAHHAFPFKGTVLLGVLNMFDDVIRIQLICAAGGTAWMYAFHGGHTVLSMQLTMLKLLICAYGSQVGHYYSHFHKAPPKIVGWLQDSWILLPRTHHQQHHKAPHNLNWGIVNGASNFLMNPLLQAVGRQDKYLWAPTVALWAFLSVADVPMMGLAMANYPKVF